MIAIESFKRFRMIDIIAIIVLDIVWLLINLIMNKLLGPQSSYILSLFIATILMSFTVHLVRKAGSATLFYFIGALLTYNINDLGITGLNKIIALLITGIVFELIYIIFKLEIKNVQVDIVAATAFSSMIIPIFTAFLSISIALSMISTLINWALLSFFIGLSGAIISFIIWHNLRTTKLILRYEYMQ